MAKATSKNKLQEQRKKEIITQLQLLGVCPPRPYERKLQELENRLRNQSQQ